MTEHPILFTAPMVRAILEGRKTQTRRIVKPQPPTSHVSPVCANGWWMWQKFVSERRHFDGETTAKTWDSLCPYGQPGDRLWVRETWQYADWTEDGYPFIRYRSDGEKVLHERIQSDEQSERLNAIWAELSKPENYDIDQAAADRRWRSPRFMPRWASRITLALADVRVERLHEISDEAALHEGVRKLGYTEEWGYSGWSAFEDPDDFQWSRYPRLAFKALWDSINIDRAPWASNPWVWVLTFKRVTP